MINDDEYETVEIHVNPGADIRREVSVRVDMLGGQCPVQAEGVIDGLEFYFRARGEHWNLNIGCDVVVEPFWNMGALYADGDPFAAGWMEEQEAIVFLTAAAAWFVLYKEFVVKHKGTYKQCNLQHQDSHQVAWLPVEYCQQGKRVTLAEDSKEWTVTSVGDLERGHDEVMAWGRDWKNQRKASDI